jgi:hypothetical protein
MTGTYSLPVQRFLIGRVAATIGAVVALIGTFMPWLRSGAVRRNSYEILSLVERLGISRSSLVGWGVRLWPIAPLLLACAVTLQWFPRRWVTGPVAVVAVVYVGGVGAAVESASAPSLMEVEYGPNVTLAGAVILAAGALMTGAVSATRRGLREPREG